MVVVALFEGGMRGDAVDSWRNEVLIAAGTSPTLG